MATTNPPAADSKTTDDDVKLSAQHLERVETVHTTQPDVSDLSIWQTIKQNPAQFGEQVSPGTYIIPAYWQSLWNAMAQVCTGFGAWGAGPISDRFGRRISFCVSGLISIAGTAVIYTATTPGAFLGGKMINAIGLGMALTTGQIYVSEITPLRIRGVALSAYAFSMNLGYLIAASVAFDRVTIMDQSSYKVLFASNWVWPLVIVLFCFVIPESPYYLVRKGNLSSATKGLSKLYNKSISVEPILASMVRITREEENQANASSETSYMDLFKGTNWRRTRIILYTNGLNQMIGATFISNAPYFMITAGLSSSQASMMIELGIGFALISSFFTFWFMTFVGRRKMILSGISLAVVLFLIMGIAASVSSSKASLWCVGVTLQLVWFTIGPSIGPSISLAGEISSLRLRAKSQSLGFFFNYSYSTVWNVAVPYMFNATEGNLGGKMGWIFLATSCIAWFVVWAEIPETKDRTYGELDEMFNERVPARKFKAYRTERRVADAKVEDENPGV
ncbi:Alpha-glucosides permease MPH2 [Botrytis cinerea]